jgi:hypothetical protein
MQSCLMVGHIETIDLSKYSWYIVPSMGKTSFIKEVIDQARSIPKFIYNHTLVLSLMRRHTRNRELRRPAITRFATNFLTLQSLLQCQFELKQMFVCDEWQDCT